ncbi:MAG: hypothetical protein ACK4SO_05910, partial [Candidatus Kapaibacteriota bacterium]
TPSGGRLLSHRSTAVVEWFDRLTNHRNDRTITSVCFDTSAKGGLLSKRGGGVPLDLYLKLFICKNC